MELCILTFDGSDTAASALKTAIDAQADRNPWMFDIGTIARPLIGRVKISATFPDGETKTVREGDIAKAAESLGAYTGYFVSSLAGPLSSMFVTVNAGLDAGAAGSQAEQRLLHLDQIKQTLSRDSSALVLIASSDICDAFVRMFDLNDPKPGVIRHDVSAELRKRLETLHRMVTQGVTQEVIKAVTEGRPANP